MPTSIRILDESEFCIWDEFNETSESGSVYSSTHYLDALCTGVGGGFSVVVLEKGGNIQGGIAIYQASNRWGRFISPRTLLPYNGIVTTSMSSSYPSRLESTLHQVQNELAAYLESRGEMDILIRSCPPTHDARVFTARGWKALPTYTYLVDITDIEVAWNIVDRKIKSQVRKARNLNYIVTKSEDFDTFYSHHCLACEAKGFSPYMPRAAFRAFFEKLSKRGLATIYQVENAFGKSFASQLVLLGPWNTSHIVVAGSDRAHDADGVNALLRWCSFEHLAARGVRKVDLTDASLNSVSRFKKKFGAELGLSLAVAWRNSAPIRRAGEKAESLLRARLRR